MTGPADRTTLFTNAHVVTMNDAGTEHLQRPRDQPAEETDGNAAGGRAPVHMPERGMEEPLAE